MAEISLDNFLGTTETTAQPEQQNNVISLNDFLNVKPQYPSLSETNKKQVQDYWSSLSSDGMVSPDDTTYGFSQYSVPEAANKFKNFMVGEKSDIANHIAKGFQLSNPGLMYNFLYIHPILLFLEQIFLNLHMILTFLLFFLSQQSIAYNFVSSLCFFLGLPLA